MRFNEDGINFCNLHGDSVNYDLLSVNHDGSSDLRSVQIRAVASLTQHIRRTADTATFGRAKRQVGIRKAGGIHSLRHAFATHSLQAGMPIHQLQQVLGHEHISTTMRYAHWLPETQQGGQTIDLLAGLDAAAVCYT